MTTDYQCPICGFLYDPKKGDPEAGVPPGTLFLSLPPDWTCPQCGAKKGQFIAAEGAPSPS